MHIHPFAASSFPLVDYISGINVVSVYNERPPGYNDNADGDNICGDDRLHM